MAHFVANPQNNFMHAKESKTPERALEMPVYVILAVVTLYDWYGPF